MTRSGFQREAGLIQGGERARFAMPVPLRTDFDAHALRTIARATKDGPQARRLLALAAIYDEATRTAAVRIGGGTVQIVRGWVGKVNAHGPQGLINRKPPGQPSKLADAHRAALQAIVEQGPIPAIHGVVRWRLIDLIQWVWEEFRITISKQTLSRELRAMNDRKLSARPRHHAKNEAAVAAFKKNFPARLEELAKAEARGKPLEIWFAGEARIGQKNTITRRWAKRGTRPSAPKDQRTASAYVFGAICPAEGKGAGLVLPRCTTAGMNLHLNEIAQAVAPGAHALVLVDQGWLASVAPAGDPGQHHPCAASGQGARVEPGRDHLAADARQLDLEPDLRLLPRHPRSLLRGVEQTHRPALAHHVHRPARLGSPVLINGTWYKSLYEWA